MLVIWQQERQSPALTILNIHRVSEKQSKLFSSELRQIFTNFDNFWQKDGQENRIV